MYVAGRLVVPSAGHCHYLPGLANQADGPYGFRRAVRQEIRAGADFIKIANNGADMTQEELNAAVDEAHRLGKKAACHTGKPPAQRMAIEAGVDTFEHGTPTEEEIDLAVEKGIAWTPTINCSEVYLKWSAGRREHADLRIARQAEEDYEKTLEYLEGKRTSMAYALGAGLRVLAGTDSWSREVRFDALADEIQQLAKYGCTPRQALLAATAWAAEAMGWEEIGTLAEDKLADLVAVPGNPLEDLSLMSDVTLVVREGEIVKEG
jgi:imidazolonepropionase-like amidohydrolase